MTKLGNIRCADCQKVRPIHVTTKGVKDELKFEETKNTKGNKALVCITHPPYRAYRPR